MEFLNGLTMGRRRFSALAIPRSGLRLSVTNNGDGTATWRITGYEHPDSGGHVEIYAGLLGGNDLLNTPDIIEQFDFDATSGTITINDPSAPYYFAYVAHDEADELIEGGTSNVVGPYPITGDTFGNAYAASLEANDSVDLDGDYEAEMDFFGGLRADGILSKAKAAFICGYGTQNSCRRELVSLNQGTIPGGTVDALAGRVSFTGNGRIRFPAAMNTYVSINSQCFIVDYFDAPSGAGIYDLGAYDGTDVNAVFRTTSDNCAWGSFGAGLTVARIASGHVAMWSRTSATAGGAYSWNGTTFTTRVTSGSLSGGGDTSVVPVFGGLNNNGTDESFSNSRYRSIWICDGMSSAELQLFCADYQAYKIAKGWV
jgi:hypothetical protein